MLLQSRKGSVPSRLNSTCCEIRIKKQKEKKKSPGHCLLNALLTPRPQPQLPRPSKNIFLLRLKHLALALRTAGRQLTAGECQPRSAARSRGLRKAAKEQGFLRVLLTSRGGGCSGREEFETEPQVGKLGSPIRIP